MAFTALASAEPDQGSAPDTDQVCIDMRYSAEVPPAPSELKRCWHQIGMGKIVTACTPEPSLAQGNMPFVPECGYGGTDIATLNAGAPQAPLTDLPPPKV